MSKSKMIKLSTLMAANKAVKNIEIAEAALKDMNNDYVKKTYSAGFQFYGTSSGSKLHMIPLDCIKAALEAMLVQSKVDLEKLGVEVDA